MAQYDINITKYNSIIYKCGDLKMYETYAYLTKIVDISVRI